jgi:hypothetical protein
MFERAAGRRKLYNPVPHVLQHLRGAGAGSLVAVHEEDRERPGIRCRPFFTGLAAGERQQALGEKLGPLCRLYRAGYQTLSFFIAAQPTLDKVEAADDGGEQVIEIVRDSACELPHGFELLPLARHARRPLEECRQRRFAFAY